MGFLLVWSGVVGGAALMLIGWLLDPRFAATLPLAPPPGIAVFALVVAALIVDAARSLRRRPPR